MWNVDLLQQKIAWASGTQFFGLLHIKTILSYFPRSKPEQSWNNKQQYDNHKTTKQARSQEMKLKLQEHT